MVHSIAQNLRCCSGKDTAIADGHAIMDVVTVQCEDESCAICVLATLGFPSTTSPRGSIHPWSVVACPFCALFCWYGMPYLCGASCGARSFGYWLCLDQFARVAGLSSMYKCTDHACPLHYT